MKSKSRIGFTVLELIASIGVVAILLSLLIPAVQHVRERSRTTVCQSNLRQIGIALAGYAESFGMYPAGGTYDGFSLHAVLLPGLGQEPLYDSFNFSINAYGVANATAASRHVSIYLCPSDGAAQPPFPCTSYAGNSGRGMDWFGDDGLFAINSNYIRPQHVVDGLNHTIALSEWLIGDKGITGGMLSTPFPPTPVVPASPELFMARCREMNPDAIGATKGLGWSNGAFGFTLYNHLLGPDENSCTNASQLFSAAITADSNHGGVNVLAADGSVKLLSSSLDLLVWRSMGTKNAGDY